MQPSSVVGWCCSLVAYMHLLLLSLLRAVRGRLHVRMVLLQRTS
jgi:hypothetical protein